MFLPPSSGLGSSYFQETVIFSFCEFSIQIFQTPRRPWPNAPPPVAFIHVLIWVLGVMWSVSSLKYVIYCRIPVCKLWPLYIDINIRFLLRWRYLSSVVGGVDLVPHITNSIEINFADPTMGPRGAFQVRQSPRIFLCGQQLLLSTVSTIRTSWQPVSTGYIFKFSAFLSISVISGREPVSNMGRYVWFVARPLNIFSSNFAKRSGGSVNFIFKNPSHEEILSNPFSVERVEAP